MNIGVHCSLGALLFFLTAGAWAEEAPAEFVWEDRIDLGEHKDEARDLRTTDDRVIVGGMSFLDRAPGNEARDKVTHVSVYELSNGQLEWRREFPGSGGGPFAIDPQRAFKGVNANFSMTALDLDTGETLWESAEPDLPTHDDAQLEAAAIDNGVLFTAGSWAADPFKLAPLIQARKPATGEILWEDRQVAPSAEARATAEFMVAQNGRLAVWTLERSFVGEDGSGTIIVYSALTGEEIWRYTESQSELEVRAIALCQRTLFVVGERDLPGSHRPSELRILAFNSKTGVQKWEQLSPVEGQDHWMEGKVLCAGPNAFVSAVSRKDSVETAHLLALSRSRGRIRWQREFGPESDGALLRLEKGSLLFKLNDKQLQSYTRRTGRLQWETNPFPENGFLAEVDLTSAGELAVLAGADSKTGTKGDIVIRLLR